MAQETRYAVLPENALPQASADSAVFLSGGLRRCLDLHVRGRTPVRRYGVLPGMGRLGSDSDGAGPVGP